MGGGGSPKPGYRGYGPQFIPLAATRAGQRAGVTPKIQVMPKRSVSMP